MASTKKPRPDELPARLASFFKQHIPPAGRLRVGLSGGLDSCVLLHLLHTLKPQLGVELTAMHVNHGLSPNASAWEGFCAALCERWAIPYSAVRVEVPHDSGLGIEAAARQARYTALLAPATDVLVLAHHRDDQAETLLLQLLRGAGVQGLAAMGAVSAMAGTDAARRIFRPLLDIPRSTLEAYAALHGLTWIEDESNLDLAYDRNFLRHRVFPAMEARFPACRTTLARSAAHLAEAAQLLEEIARADAGQWIRAGHLQLEGLRTLSLPRAKNLLRHWLAGYVPQALNERRLNELYRQLTEARADAQLCVPVEGGAVHRYRGAAWFAPVSSQPAAACLWQGEPVLAYAGGRVCFSPSHGAGLSLGKLQGTPLSLRPRTGGERLRLDVRRPTRSLRLLFQEAGIPPWARTCWPMVYCGERLVAVPGIGVASDFQAMPGEPSVEISWFAGP